MSHYSKPKFSGNYKVTSSSNHQPQYFTKMANSIGGGPVGLASSSSVPRNNNNTKKSSPGGSSSGRLMSMLKMDNHLEYSHPPLPEEPSGLYDTLITEADMAYMKKKFVKVTSTGEVEMEPDVVEFCVKITTSKLDPVQGKESVKKRKDFVLSAIKKFGIPDNNVTSSTIIKRIPLQTTDNVNIDDLFLLEAQELAHALKRDRIQGKRQTRNQQPDNNAVPEVDDNNKAKDQESDKRFLVYFEELCVKCYSLSQYLKVFSICNEKLDRHVEISRPVVRCSSTRLQASTQQAIRLAMNNGIQKANDMITNFKQSLVLGRVYYSVEDSLEVDPVHDYDSNQVFETFGWKRMNKMVRSRLTTVFELDHIKTRRMI